MFRSCARNCCADEGGSPTLHVRRTDEGGSPTLHIRNTARTPTKLSASLQNPGASEHFHSLVRHNSTAWLKTGSVPEFSLSLDGSSSAPEDATWCLNIVGLLCVDDPEMHPFIKFSDFKPLWTESCTVMSVVCRGVTESDLCQPGFGSGSPRNTKKAAVAQALEVLKDRIEAWPGSKIIGITGDLHVWRLNEALIRELAGDLLFPKGHAKLCLTSTAMMPLAFAAWGNLKVLCLTEATVEHYWQLCVPLPEDQRQRLVVCSLQGLQDLDTLRTHEPSDEFDEAFVELVDRVIQEEKEETGDSIQVIVSAGMNLTLLTHALMDVFELPVFDSMKWVQFLAMGCTPSEFNYDTRRKKKKESIGVVRLDYHYPPAVGDAAHEDTFRFKMHFRQVNELTFEAAQQGLFTDAITQNFEKAVHELEDIGVVGISGDCGFMMHYQSLARVCAKETPVFMSALILAGTLSLWCGREERVLLLTANSEAFSSSREQLLQGHGIRTDLSRFLIKDPRSVPGFEAVERAEKVDVPLVSRGIGKFVKKLLKRDRQANPSRPIGFILLECTELPPYADIIRTASGLPTYDVTSLIDFFHRCTSETAWNMTGYPPHNPRFWQKQLDRDGRLKPGLSLQDIPK